VTNSTAPRAGASSARDRADGGAAASLRAVEAWRVGPGSDGVQLLDPGSLSLPTAPQDAGSGVGTAGEHPTARHDPAGRGPVTWARLADVDALLDAAALVTTAQDPYHRDLARHVRHPLANVRRVAADWLLLLTPTVWFTEEDRQVHTGELAVLLGPGTVLTAEKGDADVHAIMYAKLCVPGDPHGTPMERVVSAAVLAVVGGASQVELRLGDAVAETERVVFDEQREDPVERIYDLKREITEARRALMPVTAELPELLDADVPAHLGLDRRVLERILATVERIDRHLDAHDDLLSDMLQVHMSQVSVRQNEDMRKISAWAAILVYPTIVAGVYGMNFDHMPELHWTLGYPLALALMAVGCLVLYRLFRRAGWL
jgi:magnesium transporter